MRFCCSYKKNGDSKLASIFDAKMLHRLIVFLIQMTTEKKFHNFTYI